MIQLSKTRVDGGFAYAQSFADSGRGIYLPVYLLRRRSESCLAVEQGNLYRCRYSDLGSNISEKLSEKSEQNMIKNMITARSA